MAAVVEMERPSATGSLNDGNEIVLATADGATAAAIRDALVGSPFRVVAEPLGTEAAVDVVVVGEPALCLLDVDLPGDALAACRAIRDEAPDTKVVVLSRSSDDDVVLAVLATGAAGCLVTTGGWDRLVPALEGVLRGEPALPRTLVARLVSEVRTRRGRWIPLGPAARKLTEREWQVLEHLTSGLTPNQIADRLALAPVTVRSHAASIVRKLGVADRDAAIALARRSLERPPS